MPLGKLSAVDGAGRQRVVAEHPRAVREHVRPRGPSGVSHTREAAQPIIEFGGAAVEHFKLMIARERRDPKVGQGAIS